MASIQFSTIKPKDQISTKATDPLLRKALTHIFKHCDQNVWLVGGTALAGYYAEHRRSDDLDLFALSPESHRLTVLAVQSLHKAGASLTHERRTPNFYHTDIQWSKHTFTVDVVLEENLKNIGNAIQAKDGVYVADLSTLFMMKAACLVSRASEKDLFDLDWLLEKMDSYPIADLVEAGAKMDGGLNVETLLISLTGATLRKEACHFLLSHSNLSVEQAYQKILLLQKKLIADLLEYEKKLPLSAEIKAIAQTIKDQKKLS